MKMKMCKLKYVFLVAALGLASIKLTDSSQQVMKDLSINFAKALSDCKREMDLPETINDDFNNFWKDDYTLTNRDTGCAIMCLSTKLKIIDPDLNLHHGNAKDFAMKHGADEELATDLVNIIHMCEKTGKEIEDNCLRVLYWSKCFKVEIHKKGIAPEMDVVIAEVLAEV